MTFYIDNGKGPITPWYILRQDYDNGLDAQKAHANVLAAGFDVKFETVVDQYAEWTEEDIFTHCCEFGEGEPEYD